MSIAFNFVADNEPRLATAKKKLPTNAKRKLRHLESLDRKYLGERDALNASLIDLRERESAAGQRLAQYQRDQEEGEFVSTQTEIEPVTGLSVTTKSPHPGIAEAEAEIAELKVERKRLVADLRTVPPALLPRINDHLSEFGLATRFIDWRAQPLKLPKGTSVHQQLEHVRSLRLELLEEQERVRRVRRPADEARTLARQEIERLAKSGKPDLRGLFRGGSFDRQGNFSVLNDHASIVWPRQKLPLEADGHFQFSRDGVAFAAWLFKEQILKRIDVEIGLESESKASMSAGDKARRLSEIDAELLLLERQEEELVCRCEAEHFTVIRRSDANPLALLEIAIVEEFEPASS